MNDVHNIPFIGRSLPRREDRRLLTGRGQFIADFELPHMLHAVFVRSPLAHGRIKAIDLSRAAAAPGVVYALGGPELAQLLPPVPDTQLVLPSKWTTQVQHKFINPQQPLLAHDKVRHVGVAVAVVVADSRYAAEDAAQLVELDLDPLPAVLDPEAALADRMARPSTDPFAARNARSAMLALRLQTGERRRRHGTHRDHRPRRHERRAGARL